MTPTQMKEEISKAYVHAVAARCGFAVGTWSQDASCIDTTIGAAGVIGKGTLADPKIDLQLKCTSDQDVDRDDHVAWQLSREHYERLTARASLLKLLVVLVLPSDESKWVQHDIDQLVLRRCAYWILMTGMPAIAAESKVVHVPKAQTFSPVGLMTIMERVSRGESP